MSDDTVTPEPEEEADEPVKNILQAILDAMEDEDDAFRQCYKFIDWYNNLTDDQKKISNSTLIYICGWGFNTLMEKAEFWDPEDI